ncbi:MAG: glycosidase, partial [Chitinophagales bacterium]
MNITKNSVRLYASAKAVITQFLHLPGSDRVSHVVKRVKGLSEEEVDNLMEKAMKDFSRRHRNVERIFSNHFCRIEDQYGSSLAHLSSKKKLLLGAFFTKEYSIQAAALFNPSIVPHPDQRNLNAGELRLILSLRATGEGHISSIVFQTGVVDDKANIRLDDPSLYYSSLQKNSKAKYSREFIGKCAASFPGFDNSVLNILPDLFTAEEALHLLKTAWPPDSSFRHSVNIIAKVVDTNYELESSSHLPINEKVIFPNAKGESMGMEDVRFVKFMDGAETCYYGTYTAYNGQRIQTQMIATKDFDVFNINTLYGTAISDKGMALFPEKINGKYAMITRQGGEMMNIMFSGDLYRWDDYELLMEPQFPWELVQLGNCGSPIKTEQGWLLLTHGVGVMRTYVISAILLDLKDPSKIIGRLHKPLL